MLDAAARSGELSAEQTAAIADAATADPSSEARLVAKAKDTSLAVAQRVCPDEGGRLCRPGGPSQQDPRRALPARPDRRRRRLAPACATTPRWAPSSWPPGPDPRPAVQRRPHRGTAGALDAYAADALVEAVCGTGDEETKASRGATKVIARVDLPAFLRGYPPDGETGEIAGFGPVAVSTIRDLMDTADPFLAAVVINGEAVVGVAHLGRRPRASQQTALEWLYPTCAVEGCTTTAWLEVDHRIDWADSHLTVFDLLDRLCSHHHNRKTLDGWALVEGRGKRAFVAPDDPRHPRHPGHAHDPPA